MSVKYAPSKLKVPPGFQNLLEGLAREVLREQPHDIIAFAATYFKEQVFDRSKTGKDDAKKGADMEALHNAGSTAAATPAPTASEPPATPSAAAPAPAATAEEEIDIDLEDPAVADAANKIQSVFRKKSKASSSSAKSVAKEEPVAETAPAADVEAAPAATEGESTADLSQDEAASKIQALARGKKARDEVAAIRDSKTNSLAADVPADAPADGEAAPAESDSQLTQDEAAAKIQALARGKKARDEVAEKRSSQANSVVDDGAAAAEAPAEADAPAADTADLDAENEAAAKIQALARGKKARDEVAAIRESKSNAVAEDVAEATAAEKPAVAAADEPVEAPAESGEAPAEAAPAEAEAAPEAPAEASAKEPAAEAAAE